MKLLYDQNLSRKLVGSLREVFKGSQHTSMLGLDRAEDKTVWNHAKAEGYTIVSKDTDFLHLALLRGFPPKVIRFIDSNWCYGWGGVASRDHLSASCRKDLKRRQLACVADAMGGDAHGWQRDAAPPHRQGNVPAENNYNLSR